MINELSIKKNTRWQRESKMGLQVQCTCQLPSRNRLGQRYAGTCSPILVPPRCASASQARQFIYPWPLLKRVTEYSVLVADWENSVGSIVAEMDALCIMHFAFLPLFASLFSRSCLMLDIKKKPWWLFPGKGTKSSKETCVLGAYPTPVDHSSHACRSHSRRVNSVTGRGGGLLH